MTKSDSPPILRVVDREAVDDVLNRDGVNWTYGCISLLGRDIRELYDIVPVGTRVVIEP